MNTDLKTQIIQRVTPDLEQVEQALKQNLSPHLDLVKNRFSSFVQRWQAAAAPFVYPCGPDVRVRGRTGNAVLHHV